MVVCNLVGCAETAINLSTQAIVKVGLDEIIKKDKDNGTNR
jgi:hypothetical protein